MKSLTNKITRAIVGVSLVGALAVGGAGCMGMGAAMMNSDDPGARLVGTIMYHEERNKQAIKEAEAGRSNINIILEQQKQKKYCNTTREDESGVIVQYDSNCDVKKILDPDNGAILWPRKSEEELARMSGVECKQEINIVPVEKIMPYLKSGDVVKKGSFPSQSCKWEYPNDFNNLCTICDKN